MILGARWMRALFLCDLCTGAYGFAPDGDKFGSSWTENTTRGGR